VSGAKLSVLIAVFFFTSVISVVTGSTSLITVPVMIALGMPASVALTIIGSGLGALLLLSISLKALQITIAVAMIGVAVFSLLNKNLGRVSHDAPASNVEVITGYAATSLLAIYGGFFSGGYVTMLLHYRRYRVCRKLTKSCICCFERPIWKR
jgi:uncharacterized protein